MNVLKNKNFYNYLYVSLFLVLVILGGVLMNFIGKPHSTTTNFMSATVLSVANDKITVQDDYDLIYTFDMICNQLQVGDRVVFEYSGLLDKDTELQNISIIDYDIHSVSQDTEDISLISNLGNDGIFSKYYNLAKSKLDSLSLEEKIGQLFLVKYPGSQVITDLNQYPVGGFIFYENDFSNKTRPEVIDMIQKLQNASKIPLFTAVDEEGGNVVRVSSNPQLASTKFLSPRSLYQSGGFDLIRQDTIEKSNLLEGLGLNLNLAPVVDVSTDSGDYMYSRSLGENTELTSTYAKTVIEASKAAKVSYVLKHFPGYGNNQDTHTAKVTDSRSYDDIRNNDLPPFQAGIDAGAEAVLVSHNVVTNIDDTNPASLSAGVHNLLRNTLKFTGVIITDDLSMGALDGVDQVITKAILAGNDLLMISDYKAGFQEVKTAIENGIISEDTINKIALRNLAWKYAKGLMIEKLK